MAEPTQSRLAIQKTYKMFIGGAFPRTESGRFYNPTVAGKSLGNICLASRKDMRNAVVAARAAQPAWYNRSAYNRSQILYRVAEMLEDRREQFLVEMRTQGLTAADATAEFSRAVDRLIYYSGWCDKYQQIFSSVNPVASSHFNFSMLEPKGVVFLFANQTNPLLGLVSLLAPIISSGNTVVILASESKPLSSITFSEVLNTSDVPAGVVNILTGSAGEICEHVAKHLDIDAIAADGIGLTALKTIETLAAESVKSVKQYSLDWNNPESESPYLIADFCEVKTTWHPVERISAAGTVY